MSKLLPHTQPFGIVGGVLKTPPHSRHWDFTGFELTLVDLQLGHSTTTGAATPADVDIKNPLAGADARRLYAQPYRPQTRLCLPCSMA
jgi:hypothetical protein